MVPISALEHFSYCPRQCALIPRGADIRRECLHSTWAPEPRTRRLGREYRSPRCTPTTRSAALVRPTRPDRQSRCRGVPPGQASTDRIQSRHPRRTRRGPTVCTSPLPRGNARCARPIRSALLARYQTQDTDQDRSRTSEPHHQGHIPSAPVNHKPTTAAPVNDNRCRNCSLVNACLPKVVGEPSRIRGYQGALFKPAAESTVDRWFDV